MKQGIHPNWHDDCVVTCSCGNTFITGSTFKTLQTDICSACHPFYTGEMKFIDKQGRVERFQAKMKKAEELRQKNLQKKAVKVKTQKKQEERKSLKDMLSEAKPVEEKAEAKK